MNQTLVRRFVVLAVLVGMSAPFASDAVAQEGSASPHGNTTQKLMRKYFSKLDQRLDGRLAGLIDGLDGVSRVQHYFRFVTREDTSEQARQDYEAFQKMFVECVKGISTPAGVEYAVLADSWARIAGPYIVLDTIGPHVGPDGELAGLTDRPSDVMRFVDGRLSAHKMLSFRPFIAYLRPNAQGTAKAANAERLIDYMMRTDPVTALNALLQLELGMQESNGKVNWAFIGEDVAADVRADHRKRAEQGKALYRLNVMVRAVRDLDSVGTEIPRGLSDRVRGLLVAQSSGDSWWQREYVAVVMARSPLLRDDSTLSRLKSDASEFVRRAAGGK